MGPTSQMMYDETIFVSPIPNDHVCPVCCGVMHNVAQTACGHRFCIDCIKRALAMQSICPLCRTPPCQLETPGSPYFRDRAHERIILDKEVSCPTCHRTITFKEFVTDHSSKCPEAQVSCRFHSRGCSTSVKRCALAAHEACCEHRVLPCPKCATTVPQRRLTQHLLFKCRRNHVTCQACQRTVLVCRMGEHRNRCAWTKALRHVMHPM